jgi:transcriptional regulator with XRE-family HTH domain
MDEIFGATLRSLREERGLSQNALASDLGVAQRHISDWERGRVDIRLSSLRRIATLLEVPTWRLLEDGER